jgi:hypothetical protein
MFRFVRAFAAASVLLCVFSPDGAFGQDTSEESIDISVDKKATFKASGGFTTVDDNNGGLDGPAKLIDQTSNNNAGECGGAASCWAFTIKHKATWNQFGPAPGSLAFKGVHQGPPHMQEGNNFIEAAGNDGFFENGSNWNFNKKTAFTVTGRKSHPPHGHFDVVTVDVEDLKAEAGPGNKLTGGTTTIRADHHEKEVNCLPSSRTAGSTPTSAAVSYDQPTGNLHIAVGATDILDSQGGASGGVEAAYAADPVTSAIWAITDMQLVGFVDGRYQFAGGSVSLADPSSQFDFSGEIDEYWIGDTSPGSTDSYGVFEELRIKDVADAVDGPSTFLRDFVDNNLLGKGYSDLRFSRVQGVGLTFSTATGLDALTSGFTQTVTNVPATVLVTLCDTPSLTPALSMGGQAVLVLALLGSLGGALAWRRRTHLPSR